MANLHEGHRQRLKERFLREGLDHFEPHTVLELLLFYAVPQRDTNELAHRLIARFGSLDAVFDAAFDELCAVEGIGRNTATLLKLVPDLTRRYLDSADHEQVLLTSVQAIGDFLRPKFLGRTKEMVFLLCLNNKGGLTYGDFIAEGTIDSAPMYSRTILEAAMRCPLFWRTIIRMDLPCHLMLIWRRRKVFATRSQLQRSACLIILFLQDRIIFLCAIQALFVWKAAFNGLIQKSCVNAAAYKIASKSELK